MQAGLLLLPVLVQLRVLVVDGDDPVGVRSLTPGEGQVQDRFLGPGEPASLRVEREDRQPLKEPNQLVNVSLGFDERIRGLPVRLECPYPKDLRHSKAVIVMAAPLVVRVLRVEEL